LVSKLRVALSVVAIVVLGLGVFLFYQPGVKVTPIEVSQQYNLCTQTVSTIVIPFQSTSFPCTVAEGVWIDASLHSSYNVTYQAFFSGQSTSSESILGPQTAETLTLDIPVPSNGTITLMVTNPGPNSTTISGSLSAAVEIHVADTMSQNVYPHRLTGAAVAGAGAVAAFLLIWDPMKVASRALGRLTRQPRDVGGEPTQG